MVSPTYCRVHRSVKTPTDIFELWLCRRSGTAGRGQVPVRAIRRSFAEMFERDLDALIVRFLEVGLELVLREKNSMTLAIGVRSFRSSASIFVVEPTSMRPSRS